MTIFLNLMQAYNRFDVSMIEKECLSCGVGSSAVGSARQLDQMPAMAIMERVLQEDSERPLCGAILLPFEEPGYRNDTAPFHDAAFVQSAFEYGLDFALMVDSFVENCFSQVERCPSASMRSRALRQPVGRQERLVLGSY
jgi:hypothetical protein